MIIQQELNADIVVLYITSRLCGREILPMYEVKYVTTIEPVAVCMPSNIVTYKEKAVDRVSYIVNKVGRIVEEYEKKGVYKYFDKEKNKTVEYLEELIEGKDTIQALLALNAEFVNCIEQYAEEIQEYHFAENNDFFEKRKEVIYGILESHIEKIQELILEVSTGNGVREEPDEITKSIIERTRFSNAEFESIEMFKEVVDYLNRALEKMDYNKILNAYAMLLCVDYAFLQEMSNERRKIDKETRK